MNYISTGDVYFQESMRIYLTVFDDGYSTLIFSENSENISKESSEDLTWKIP